MNGNRRLLYCLDGVVCGMYIQESRRDSEEKEESGHWCRTHSNAH